MDEVRAAIKLQLKKSYDDGWWIGG